MRKREAFTLIELIAVLVILAILALIVTPLVLNIVKKARVSADKRSIDAYGRSIELAVADYLLDKGEFPTSVDQLTIEYAGDEVVCNTIILNEDTSVYLAECTVGGRIVSKYTYGIDKSPSYTVYKVGDEVTYNSVKYYVIKDSDKKESTVTLLKAEPLTYEEVQTYSNGMNLSIKNQNGYGGIAYYESENCYYQNGSSYGDGCILDYEQSKVKIVIDSWSNNNIDSKYLYKTSLITFDDLIDNMGIIYKCGQSSCYYDVSDSTPQWVYTNDYIYWTKSSDESMIYAIGLGSRRTVGLDPVPSNNNTIRPVIVLSKSAL